MNWSRVAGESVLWTVFLVGGFIVNQRAVTCLETDYAQLTVHRLEKTADSLLEKAHESKDDLAMQETVRALGQAPGIMIACVIDENKKILAHNQPSQLGQLFSSAGITHPLFVSHLGEEPHGWGRLILEISDRSLHPAKAFQIKTAMTGIGLLWIALITLSAIREERQAAQKKQIADLRLLLEDEKQKSARWERNTQESHRRLSFWMEMAVEQIPQPIILLDHQQRVLAINKAGGLRLGLAPKSLLGKSWQEIPALSVAGESLGKSLEQTNEIFHTLGTPRLQLCSFISPVDGLMGTWITVE